jgi:predicted transcriptional regulator
MSLKIVTGSLTDFLESARETAREIDAGQSLTPKQTLWVEAEDLVQLLQPQRLRLVHYLKSHSRVVLLDLAQALQRQPRSVSRDLTVLAKYQLIRLTESPHTHRQVDQLVEPLFDHEGIELRVRM